MISYEGTPSGVLLKNPDNFNLTQIFECGQCFRWKHKFDEKTYQDYWEGAAFRKLLRIDPVEDNCYLFHCTIEDFESIWIDYFDLRTDYSVFINSIDPSDQFLTKAASYGSGIRILNQDPWETLISFIISQQNNIPRIKRIIENMCIAIGDKLQSESGEPYYAFPTNLQILDKYQYIENGGFGYRDWYVINASKRVLLEPSLLQSLVTMSSQSALSVLKSFNGIGDKVANCVLLFGLHHKEVFPVDVWIRKILDKYYPEGFSMTNYDDYSGVIQQYMYYYERMITKL